MGVPEPSAEVAALTIVPFSSASEETAPTFRRGLVCWFNYVLPGDARWLIIRTQGRCGARQFGRFWENESRNANVMPNCRVSGK
jgi:hypothetical protein